ncbi:alkaline phosphatase [Bacillus sp. T3]|uniref:alkaline phosphatase n=1 Tax=Bacillus sp. T3 TaxID=467262 RepID=UPI00298176E7|nr:alkaline phosphatase [Bacillus sp. T3]
MKPKLGLVLVLVMALIFPNRGGVAAAWTGKNVIMMVMDGTSSNAVTLARLYKGGPLALDGILVGGVKTASLASAITDSPAAGTALATGHKTLDDVVGMVPGMDNKSLVPGRELN